ncbi:MAG: hypothetical protein L3J41_10480 [Melioribacteraceae bacterium]|nr:hypothetical protein [Melioribacteraceae bacterium]
MTKKVFKILLLGLILVGIVANTPLKKERIRNVVTGLNSPLVEFNRISLPIFEAGVIGNPYTAGQKYIGVLDTMAFLFSSGFLLSGYNEIGELWVNGVQPSMFIQDYVKGTVENPNDTVGVYYNSKNTKHFGKEWQEWKDAVKLGAEFYDGDSDGIYNPIDKNGNGIWDEDEDRPVLYGDVMVWSAFNDAVPTAARRIRNVEPQGINIRQTIWGYQSTPEFKKTIFIKFSIENSGSVSQIFENVNFSLASDPDIGYYANDYLSSNGFGNSISTFTPYRDWQFNDEQICLNTFLLQGPIKSDYWISDNAFLFEGENLDIKMIPNAKNMNVSATVSSRYSIRNTNAVQISEAMLGLRNPDPCTDQSGYVLGYDCSLARSQYIYEGNPINEFGWNNTRGSDKATLITTGPFTLEVGKPIEIIFAMSVGTGSSGIDAYKDGQLIQSKIKEKLLYNLNPYPEVEPITITDDESIELLWDTQPQINHIIDGFDVNLKFEGYEITMYNSPSTSEFVDNKPNKKIIGRYDIFNQVFTLLQEEPEDFATEVIYKNGTQISDRTERILHKVTWDPFNNEPLKKGKPYYFSITPFGIDFHKLRSYVTRNAFVIPAFSSLAYFKNEEKIINDDKGNVGIVLGENQNDAYYKGILTEHVEGNSDVEIFYSVYDQDKVTDDLYEVSFTKVDSETFRMMMNLTNVSKDDTLFSKVIRSDFEGNVNNMQDGFLLNFDWVEPGTISSSFSGDDKWYSDFNNLHTGVFYVGRDIEKTQKIFAVNLRQSTAISVNDLVKVELRFADTSKAFRYVRTAVRYPWKGKNNPDSGFVSIPVSAYAIDKQGNEKKLTIAFLENGFFGDSLGMPDGKWNPGSNIEKTKEYLVVLNSPYTEDFESYIAYTGTDRRAADIANGYMLNTQEEISDSIKAIARSPWFNALYVVGFNTPVYQPDFNPTGTLTISPSMVLTENDKYYFKVKKEKTADEKQVQFDKINIYPNPLFGYNASSSAFGYGNDEPFITFSNLPEEVDIRIYTLSGVLIRSISKNDMSASYRWNLQNESGMRIASGMYIAIIDVPNIGQRIMKFAIIQPQKRVHYE